MNRFPLIRDPNRDYSRKCCIPNAGMKELHNFCRTLPTRIPDTSEEDVLQDEFAAAILDEQSGGFIYDNLKNF